MQQIDAIGARVPSLKEFACALVVNKIDAIAGTELAVELPFYRLADACQNFRFQLYLSARTIRPPSARVKFRWTKWKVCSSALMQALLDGTLKMSLHEAGDIRVSIRATISCGQNVPTPTIVELNCTLEAISGSDTRQA